MKICFFGDAANLHLQRIAQGLSTRGHDVHLICHKPLPVNGVTVERFRVPRASLRMPFRWEGRWRRYLKGVLRQFDVVVLFFLHDFGFTAELIEGRCFVASPRGSDVVPPPGEGLPNNELRQRRIGVLRHARRVGVSCPRFATQVAEFAGLNPSDMTLLPVGVDLKRFAPQPENPSREKPGYRVGFFKGFREVYGAADLIRAMPRVLQEMPGTRFDLVGEGATLTQCRLLALNLQVDGAISWLPRQHHAAIADLLHHWDLTVMPSRCESFGVAALESAAAGVPVVASNVGGLPDTVVDGQSGLLIPPGSPHHIAEAIIELLRDPARREHMGRFGRRWVAEHYEWGKVLSQWESVLMECTELAATAH